MTRAPQPFRSGAGRLCLDFVRTLRHRGRSDAVEELADGHRVDVWIGQFGCGDPDPHDPTRDLAARELREAIHALLTAAVATENARPLPPAPLATVNAAAGWPVPAPELGPDRRLRQRSDRPVRAALALIARDAVDLVASPDLNRVRSCANPDCGILFLDASRPGTRRWCSMRTCGNRAKKSAQRARGR